MKKKILFILIACLLFIACAGRKIPAEWKPFYELSRTEHLTSVLSSRFPDTVSVVFPWEFDEDLLNENIQVWEEVGGDIMSIDGFNLERFEMQAGASVVILSDESGSMESVRGLVDTLIVQLAKEIPADSLRLMRFGGNIIDMDAFYSREEFIEELQEFNVKADPNGTEILMALKQAVEKLEYQYTDQKIIMLITDDSFSEARKSISIENLKKIFETYGINVVVLCTGQLEPKALADFGFSSGGTFVYDILNKWDKTSLLALMKHSYRLSYIPPHNLIDGQTHQIIVDSKMNPVKRYGSYKVGGKYDPKMAEEILAKNLAELEKERNRYSTPPILLMGLRVPFHQVGSSDVSKFSKGLLDSLAEAINDIPKDRDGEIKISGFTCDLGSSAFNLNLSKKRANSVEEYLREIITKDIIYTTNGYGIENPIRPNDSEENRKLNRRVEIEFKMNKVLKTSEIPEIADSTKH